MKLSEILGRPVRDLEGTGLGVVVDVRLVQDGRPLAGPDHSLRVDGLVVGRRAAVARLGLTRPDHAGPAIVRRPARWLAGHHDYVSWTQVRELSDEIVVEGSTRELPPTP